MSEAPERVWLGGPYECGLVVGSARRIADPADVEYVRADLLAETVKALRRIVADHDERLAIYPTIENQPHRLKVMGAARAVLAKYDAARAPAPADEVSHDG